MKSKSGADLRKRIGSLLLAACMLAGTIAVPVHDTMVSAERSAGIESVESAGNEPEPAGNEPEPVKFGAKPVSIDAFTEVVPETLTLTPGKDTTEIGVTWYSDESASDGKVKFGDTVVDAKSGSATTGKKWHKATIIGLKPNTTYKYSVSNNGTDFSEEYSYTTPKTNEFTFVAVGDPQLTTGSQDKTSNWFSPDRSTRLGWAATVEAMQKKLGSQLDFIAGVGDQVDLTNVVTEANIERSETEYRNFFEPELLRSTPFAPAVGNHDRHYGFSYHYNIPNEQSYDKLQGANYGNATNDQYASAESKGNYYYTYNNALFVVLNDSAYPQNKEAAGALIANFKKTMQAAVKDHPDYQWLFVQHHKSTASVADHVADRDIQYYVEAGFEKLMDTYEVDFVLGGHDHVYARSYPMKGGTPDVTQGGSSIENANGTIYMTFTTASGLKYYELFNASGNLYVKDNEDYPYLVNGLQGSAEYMNQNLPLSNAKYLQAKKPAFTSIKVAKNSVTFDTYNVDDINNSYDSFTVTKKEEHTHTWNTNWSSDENNHWYDCDGCEERKDSAPHTSGDWLVDTAATAQTEGSRHKECTVCGYVVAIETIPATGTETIIYTIIDGADSSWQKGSGDDLKLICDGDLSKFTELKIDGDMVSEDYYNKTSGSTVITIKAAYLETLILGSHAVELVYTDGSVGANLTILAEKNSEQSSGNGGKVNPKTGDDVHIGWLILLNGSALAALTAGIVKKRRLRKR